MDNFNLKQYLVENKLTYQEKMKDKAKKLKESGTLINETTVEYSPELEKKIKMEFDVKSNYGGDKGTSSIADKSGKILGYYMEPNAKEYSVSKTDSLFGKKVYQALSNDNEFGKFLTKQPMKEAETTSKPKEQEKGHQAPKDKSKQGPSTVNEQDDMYLGIGDHGFYDQNDRPMKNFDFEYDEEEFNDFDDFISKYPNQKFFRVDNDEKSFDYRPDRNYWDKYKNMYGGPFKLRKRKMGGPLNEGKVFFGGY